MMRPKRARLQVEALEERWVPATVRLTGTNLAVSNQTGSLLVETTATPGEISITDAGQQVTVGGVSGLITITGTNANDSVAFKANAGKYLGSLFFNMGDGQDVVALQASATGGIDGSVTVVPGPGSDTTAISAATRIGGSLQVADTAGINSFIGLAALTVDGNVSVAGVTAFLSTASLSVGSDLSVSSTPAATNFGLTFTGTTTVGRHLAVSSQTPSTGFNMSGTASVGGDLSFRLGTASAVSLATTGTLVVGGNVSYVGGTGSDSVTVKTGVTVAGRAQFELGEGANSLSIAPAAQLGGALVVVGGSGGNVITALGNVGGGVSVFVGNGSNGTIVGGTVGGMVKYRGGNGSEALTLAPAVPSTVGVDVTFGTGSATFLLTSNVSLTGWVRGTGGSYTLVPGGATLSPSLTFINFP